MKIHVALQLQMICKKINNYFLMQLPQVWLFLNVIRELWIFKGMYTSQKVY